MIPTVGEVLALPVLTAGAPRLVGGRDGLGRPVRWVHVSEAADLTDLLEGGELVLSTGLPLAGGPEAASRYLRMLAAQQVAGLVVELGTHLRDVPEYLGEHADSLGLPVAALTTAIRFVDVTQQVHRLIVTDRYDEVEFARRTHEVFTSLNIARASTTDIVTRASQILGEPLVLEDLSRQVLAFCTAGVPATQLLGQWAERSRLEDSGAGDAWSTVPVGVGAERWGRLVLPGATAEASRARMVLERAAQSLQLHRMLQQERDALVVHALGGLLDDLLSGRITDDSEALARAGALGLAASSRYVPLTVRLPRRPETDALRQGEADRRLLAAVRQSVAAAGHTAIVSIRREGTVSAVMTCGGTGPVDGALRSVCTGIGERLAPGDAWAAGTAPAAGSPVAAAQGLTEAEHVAEVGLTMLRPGSPAGPDRLYRSTDVRLRGLVALLRHDHRVQAFAETELGRLLDHDARTGEHLLALLRTHLECGGSKALTARRTGLSRPTLYSRLRTLERVLGVSLETAESRTSLHTALMIVDAPEADGSRGRPGPH